MFVTGIGILFVEGGGKARERSGHSKNSCKTDCARVCGATLRLLRAGFVENRDEWGNLSCGGAQAAPRAVVKEVRIIGMPSAKLCQELKDYGVIAQNEPR